MATAARVVSLVDGASTPVQASAVRKTVLHMLHKGRASHLGASMSVVEMLIAIYGSCDIERIRSRAVDRPRVFISKGHCAAATYAVMGHFGLLKQSVLDTYHSDGSTLSGHVSHGVEFVEHSTGALGHGLPVACGCAIGLRARGHKATPVFVLVGDGELQEGAVWEALMFAKHHGLSNLVTLVDDNRISSITRTADVIDLNPIRNRFEGFGFRVFDVDGHDVPAIRQAINQIRAGSEVGVIVCRTVKGKGVPFAEDQPIWHYRTLGDEDLTKALNHLDGTRSQ